MNRKKYLAIFIALVLLALVLSGCTKSGNCELCGDYGTLHSMKRNGVTVWLCDDCYDAAKALSFVFG